MSEPIKDCPPYLDYHKPHKQQTNGERIRAMTDEELVKLIGHNSLCDQIQYDDRQWCDKQRICEDCLVAWLQQPVEVEG